MDGQVEWYLLREDPLCVSVRWMVHSELLVTKKMEERRIERRTASKLAFEHAKEELYH
jgi:hypothetical protein